MSESSTEDPRGHEAARDEERVAERADLLPEEQTAGSDAPERQAAEILRDSERRTDDPDGTRADSVQSPDLP